MDQHAVEEAEEPVFSDPAAEDSVHLLAVLGRLGGIGREGANGRLQVRHQQSCGDPFSDDVSDRQADDARICALTKAGWQVVEIAEFELWHRPADVLRKVA